MNTTATEAEVVAMVFRGVVAVDYSICYHYYLGYFASRMGRSYW